MEQLFIRILNMSLSASVLIAAVLLLRPLLRRAPKWARVLMWGLVGLRLCLPVTLRSALSLLPSASPIPADIGTQARPALDTGLPAINAAVNPILQESLAPSPAASVNPIQLLLGIGTTVWLCGAAALLLSAAVSALLLRRRVSASVADAEGVCLCDYISSPFILGVFRPRVYLPSDLPDGTRRFVLAHEQAHLRRRDYLWKPLGYCLLAVYWFNPLVWVGYVLLCRDIEFACDEAVLRAADGEDEKSAYSEALLACACPRGLRNMISACPLAFGEVGVRARVKSVLNYKKPAFWIILAAVLLCVVLAVCFLTDPKKNENGDDPLPAADGVTVAAVRADGTVLNVTDAKAKSTLLAALDALNGYAGTGIPAEAPAYVLTVTRADGEKSVFRLWPQHAADPMGYSVGEGGGGVSQEFRIDTGVERALTQLDACFAVFDAPAAGWSVRVAGGDLSGKKPHIDLEWSCDEGVNLGWGAYVGIVRMFGYPAGDTARDVCTLPEDGRVWSENLYSPVPGKTSKESVNVADFDLSEPGFYEMTREVVLNGRSMTVRIPFYVAGPKEALTSVWANARTDLTLMDFGVLVQLYLRKDGSFTGFYGFLSSYMGAGSFTLADGSEVYAQFSLLDKKSGLAAEADGLLTLTEHGTGNTAVFARVDGKLVCVGDAGSGNFVADGTELIPIPILRGSGE